MLVSKHSKTVRATMQVNKKISIKNELTNSDSKSKKSEKIFGEGVLGVREFEMRRQ